VLPVIGPGLFARPPARLRGAAARIERGDEDDPTHPPSLRVLAERLARQCHYPHAHELETFERLGDWMADLSLQWICEHYQQDRERWQLIQDLEALHRDCEPPDALASIASWDAPGFIVTHFDGLLEEALVERRKHVRVLRAVDGTPPSDPKLPLLVCLRGSFSDPSSLVLTAADNDRLWDRVGKLSPEIPQLLRDRPGRTLLFAGVNPRDPLCRRLASQLLKNGASPTQARPYFVWTAEGAEAAYWNDFRVKWVKADARDVIDGVTRALNARGEP
jgi:hypothetical protein